MQGFENIKSGVNASYQEFVNLYSSPYRIFVAVKSADKMSPNLQCGTCLNI